MLTEVLNIVLQQQGAGELAQQFRAHPSCREPEFASQGSYKSDGSPSYIDCSGPMGDISQKRNQGLLEEQISEIEQQIQVFLFMFTILARLKLKQGIAMSSRVSVWIWQPEGDCLRTHRLVYGHNSIVQCMPLIPLKR